MKISVVGIGPGSSDYLLPVARQRLAEAEVVIGYKYYFPFIRQFLSPDCECLEKDLAEEEERAKLALAAAHQGKKVVVISSGDAGIYGMASVVYEQAALALSKVEIETIPGISAFQAAAAKLGAPVGHDFCCISLSDLMTPWPIIEKRIRAAVEGDFVCCIYNPKSRKRSWQLQRCKEIFLQGRNADTPVAQIRQVTREGEEIRIGTLEGFNPEAVDMFSLVLIGNSQTFQRGNCLITPRGYSRPKPLAGEEIKSESFRQILGEMKRPDLRGDAKWALIHCIHSTADFEMEDLFHATENAVGAWHEALIKGGEIVTDVTMVQAGIRKALQEKYGIRVYCYLNDPEALALAERENLTRSQAGMRLGVERHPMALFAVGNAPTALFELGDALERGGFNPLGIVATPVGFVNVVESKLRLQNLGNVPKVMISGRKGGSTVAAAIVNAALSLDEARDYGVWGTGKDA